MTRRVQGGSSALAVVVVLLLLLSQGSAAAGADLFLRGDADTGSRVDHADAVFVLRGLVAARSPPACADAADVDDNGRVDVVDVVYLLRYLYGDGAPPPPPGASECGPDPSDDLLPRCRYERPCALTRGDVRCPGSLVVAASTAVRIRPGVFRKVTGPSLVTRGRQTHVFFKSVTSDGGRTTICRGLLRDETTWDLETPHVVWEFGPHGGGTPAALVHDGVWYVWIREDEEETQEISLLTSRDLESWDHFPRVFRIDRGGWDSRTIAGVDVVRRGADFYLYYRGSRFTNQMRSDIGLARSSDGKTWSRIAGEPVFRRSASGWDSALVADPHVLEADGAFYMLYSGHDNLELRASDSVDAVGIGKKIGLAVSSDGIEWRRCFERPVVEHLLKADNGFGRLGSKELELWFRTTDDPSGSGGRIVYQRFGVGF